MALLVKLLIICYGLAALVTGALAYREHKDTVSFLFGLAGVVVALTPLIPDFITARAILVLGLVTVAVLAIVNGMASKQLHLSHHIIRLLVTLALIAAFSVWH